MGALSFAAVPLYRLFCQATGFGGVPLRVEKASDLVLDRKMTVRFDGNVSPGLPWSFEPAQRALDVRIGESVLAFYKASNTSNETVTGTATFNVSPDAAGPYFSKVQCFCFTAQTLAPGESVDMPVSFFIDPKIVSDMAASGISEITLSYTFYAAAGPGGASARLNGGREPERGS
jgi:cytochrome c oxidase assembly protein subunit 11